MNAAQASAAAHDRGRTIVHAADDPLTPRRRRGGAVVAPVLRCLPPRSSLLPLLLVVSLYLAEGIVFRILKDGRKAEAKEMSERRQSLRSRCGGGAVLSSHYWW